MPRLNRSTALLLTLLASALAASASAQTLEPAETRLLPRQPLPHQFALPVFDDVSLHPADHQSCGKECMLRQRYAAGLLPDGSTMTPPEGGLRGVNLDQTDVLHCDLEVEIIPGATNTISGTNIMTIQSNVEGLTTFGFKLRSQYTVTNCTVTDSIGSYIVTPTAPPANSYNRNITLVRPIPLDGTFTLQIVYNGAAVSRGFGSIEFQTTAAGDPVIASLSEAYFAATWWPCKDGDVFQDGNNSDKFTLEFAIIAPSNLRSVSNGLLQGVDNLSGGRNRYRWASNYPIATYLVSFCSTVYNTWTQNFVHAGGSMPVEFNIYPGSDNPANRAGWAMCLPMLDTFGDLFGDYPFINEKYGIYQFPFGGGMEHQTNTGQGSFGESLTAHELAHQWWGDNVTCKTWADIWLNEGFATYSEALWFENKTGVPNAAELHNAMANRRPTSMNGSVQCPDTADMNRIFSSTYSYRKGAWVLHQLRHVVGDATFFQILAAHRLTHQGSAATSDDFAAVAESTYGSDLTWFFDPWVFQSGAPTYQYAFETTPLLNGQKYVRLMVRQTQTDAYPLFPMPIDVRINLAAGGPVQTKVFNDLAVRPPLPALPTQHFLIPIPNTTVSSITLDELNWILNEGKSTTTYSPEGPKLLQTVPALGATIDEGSSPAAATITFSRPITANAGHFAVTRNGSPVSFSYAYNAATYTVTLTFTAALTPGAYSVTVSDLITASTAPNPRLDGEILNPGNPASLPSGNGIPLGGAAYTFEITGAPCAVDFDGSTIADVPDIFAFLALWFANDPAADFDGSGLPVAVPDIFAFLAAWFAGCP